MVVCEEIDGAEVHAFRSCGSGKTTSAEVGESVGVAEPVCPQSSEQNAERAIEVHKSCEADGALEALKWSTGFKDDSVLRGLLVSLPDPIINEQIQLEWLSDPKSCNRGTQWQRPSKNTWLSFDAQREANWHTAL
jgi:hypothetical protein